MGTFNFRGEEYPDDILKHMRQHVEVIEAQLKSDSPHYINEFISYNNGNKINRIMFKEAFGFNTYHRKNKRMGEVGTDNEIKGIYVLSELVEGEYKVMNVGMSQTILRRFYQHTCGKNHNESTLGFHIAKDEHKKKTGNEYLASRVAFPYIDYWPETMDRIRKLRFAIVPIVNNFELYMAEVHIACHYKSFWNTFETH